MTLTERVVKHNNSRRVEAMGKRLGEFAVFIGRLQPTHNAHLQIIEHALDRYDNLIIGVGSARQAPSPRNPWTVDQRIEMARLAIPKEHAERVKFMPLRDYLYNDNQ